jgi:ubiquinone/menaquinone biosynthesis C-methylase UbiE
MDMFDLRFKNKFFDTVFHQGVLEHYDKHQIRQALEEQLRVGKKIVSSVPSNKWQGNGFGDKHFWSFREWERILCGFKIVDKFGFEYLNRPFEYRMVKYATLPIFVLNKNLREHILDSIFATNIGFVIK